MGENRQSAVSSFRSSPPPFEKSLAAMAEFFSKGPQSDFTKMSKQFAQEQVIQQAVMDYAAEMEEAERQKMEELREQEIAYKEDDDFDLDEWGDDDISNKIMEMRMSEMKDKAMEAQSWKQKGHGELSEIVEEEFLNTVIKSKYAVVHFYHREFPRCKIVDHHLTILSKNYIATKFAKIDAEKAKFFVTKLGVCVMPCICCFEDGKMVGRIDGFDLLGGVDEFPTEVLECVLGASGAISFKPVDDGQCRHCHSIFDKQRMDIVGLNKETLDSDSDE